MRILLFSGGIDSTALAWSLRPERLLFLNYGQVSAPGELRAASSIAAKLQLDLDVRALSMQEIGSGVMANCTPLSNSVPEFWPYRNQALITFAAMTYARLPVSSIVIGTVRGDGIRHNDGRAEFVEAMKNVLDVQDGPRLEAPAIDMSSEELIKESEVPMSILGWTFSCHTGEWACGSCSGCKKHREVMDASNGD